MNSHCPARKLLTRHKERRYPPGLTPDAQVVELVDALASGASGRKAVEVRVLSWAPLIPEIPETIARFGGAWDE